MSATDGLQRLADRLELSENKFEAITIRRSWGRDSTWVLTVRGKGFRGDSLGDLIAFACDEMPDEPYPETAESEPVERGCTSAGTPIGVWFPRDEAAESQNGAPRAPTEANGEAVAEGKEVKR